MVTKLAGTIRPHDQNDIGWKSVAGMVYAHYYRTHEKSKWSVSHCRLAVEKSSLRTYSKSPKCVYCLIYEQARDGLDE